MQKFTQNMLWLATAVGAALLITATSQLKHRWSAKQETQGQHTATDQSSALEDLAASGVEHLSSPQREQVNSIHESAQAGRKYLRGSLTVLDEFRQPHDQESGWFNVLLQPSGETLEVPITRGHWSFSLEGVISAIIQDMEVGDREAELHSLLELPLAPDEITTEGVNLVATWIGCGELTALASENFSKLAEVELVTATQIAQSQFLIPPPELLSQQRTLLTPIQMESRASDQTYWARSKGRAWQRFSFSCASGNTELRLLPAGSLELSVLELESNRLAKLVILKLDRELDSRKGSNLSPQIVAERTLQSDIQFHFDGLEAGYYRAQVQRHSKGEAAMTLATQDFQIHPEAEAKLQLHAQRPTSMARVQGRLLLPEDFHQMGAELILEPLGNASAKQSSWQLPFGNLRETVNELEYAWGFDRLLAGHYRLSAGDLGCAQEFELVAGQTLELTVALEGLAHVRAFVLDGRSGAHMPSSSLLWRREEPSYGSPWNMALESQQQGAFGTFEFYCSPGDLWLLGQAQGHRSDGQQVEVFEGPNEVLLEVEREPSYALELVVHEDKRASSVPPTFWSSLEATPKGHAGSLGRIQLKASGGTSMKTSSATLQFSKPGTYALTSKSPEYQLSSPLIVQVLESGSTRAVYAR